MTGTIDLTDPAQARAFAQILRDANGGGSSFGARPSSSTTPPGSNFSGAGESAGGIFKDFTGVIQRSGGSVRDFSGEMNSLAGRLPIVGGALNLFGGSVTNMVGYLEDTQRVFQNLSKVGAGFNGDLGALRSAAAMTRMPLDQFANLIGRNSQALAGLGAGVNGGAKRFAELSRAMFEDGQVIRGMMNLGYTLEEANEFLLDNATLLRRQAMMDGMSDQQVTRATLAMAENIAFMAEVTGESAEQQRQELIDAQRDGKNIAALRALEAQGIKGASEAFDTAFTGLQASPQAQAYMQDILQGNAPASKMTQNFEANNAETAAQIRQLVGIIRSDASAEEKRAAAQELSRRASGTLARESVSASNLAIARLGSFNDVAASQADVVASTENFRLGIEQMRADMARERGFTSGFGDVTFEEAQARYFERTAGRVGGQAAGGGAGQGPSRDLNIATIALADSAAGVNQEIGRNLSANTGLQQAATRVLQSIGNVAISQGQIARDAVRRALPGEVDEATLAESNFQSLFAPLITTNGLRVTIDNFEDVSRALEGMSPEQIRLLLEAGREPRAFGGPVQSLKSYLVGERGPETFIPGADGVILPNMRREMESLRSTMAAGADGAILPNMRREMESMRSTMAAMANNLRGKMQETAAAGQPLSEGSIIEQLRGVTAQTQQSMQNMPISTQRMEQLLDNLNQSMLQLLSINNIMSRNGERTAEALRGASGNLLQGVRAR